MSYSITELAANCVRGCIVAPPGKQIVQADLANIEGRVLAWLAGEEWKLKAFAAYDTILGYDAKGDPIRKGPDLYKLAYARAFNVPHESVGKGLQRQIGKVQELMLGYEGGVGAYITGAMTYGIDLDELADAVHSTASPEARNAAAGVWAWATRKKRTLGLSERVYTACEILKAGWRANHPATVVLWPALGDAFRRCVSQAGVTFDAGAHLRMRRDGAWLRLRLPSGRCLCYLQPRVDDSGDCSYMGISQYSKQWTRIKTYGGKLVENATQATARDVLAAGMPRAEAAGFEIVLSVHDELLTEAGRDRTADELAALMTAPIDWAPGLPLAAAGFTATRYRKES